MASGLPDYYQGYRPRFGGALRAVGNVNIVKFKTNTLFTVAGKGMIYGGVLSLDYTSTQKGSLVAPKIDGSYISAMSFFQLNKMAVRQPGCFVISLLKYDDTAFVYAVGISYGITFETELALAYTELEGTTPLVTYDVIYTLI